MSAEVATTDENWALRRAVQIANLSPCAKSKRGVLVWQRGRHDIGPITRPAFMQLPQFSGHNAPPRGYACDGSDACRAGCGRLCNHAEMNAILSMYRTPGSIASRWELLHVKSVDGEAVPSGPPSCWQCSRLIVNTPIQAVWLLHDTGLRSYTATEFHEATLAECDLPVIRPTEDD